METRTEQNITPQLMPCFTMTSFRNALLLLGLAVASPVMGFVPVAMSSSRSKSTSLNMSQLVKADNAKSYLDPLGIVKKPPPAPIVLRQPDPTFIPKEVDTFQVYSALRSPCDIPFQYYESTPPGAPKRAPLGEVLDNGQWE